MKHIFVFLIFAFFVSACQNEAPTENPINTIPNQTDTLYIGGHFTINGKNAIKNIAKWDGKDWYSVGSGISGFGVDVESMAIYKGNLYVGGIIDTAGNISVKNIARWDGYKWSDVGGGINGRVNSLVVFNDELYAAGKFSNAGYLTAYNVPGNNVARWNGSNWSPVGEGFNGKVYALCIYNNKLFAGGGYHNDEVEAWNGSQWVSTGASVIYARAVYSLAVYNNELYALGWGISKWNGSIWSIVGGGVNLLMTPTAIEYNNKLYVGGENNTAGDLSVQYFATWNGSKWINPEFSLNNIPYCLYVYGYNLYVGGTFNTVNNLQVNGIFKFDGKNIIPLGNGVNGYVSSMIVYPNIHFDN